MLVGEISPNVGTTGFNFLKITPTAREAAMGCVAVGFSDNASGIWYNPAGITGVAGSQVGLGYIAYAAGVQSGTVSYVTPLRSLTLGVGGYYLNSGLMKHTDENGNELGTFSSSYLNVNAGGGLKLGEKLALGLNAKLLYGGIDTFSTIGLGADLGVNFTAVPGLTLSAVGKNLGFSLKPYRTTADNLPVEFVVGMGWRIATPFRLGLDIHIPLDNSIEGRLGAEYWVHRFVCLRAGLNTNAGDLKAGSGSDILAGVGTGLGVRVQRFELDYAFTPMVILGAAHRVSLRYNLQ